jgi:hypothetical protein
MILRLLVTIWALFFGILGLRGLIDPAVYVQQFDLPAIGAVARNTIRADFSAFFLVAAGSALYGAWARDAAHWLRVPAMLFGGALLFRALGLALGDPLGPIVQTSMIAEAVSAVLLFTAARRLAPRRR